MNHPDDPLKTAENSARLLEIFRRLPESKQQDAIELVKNLERRNGDRRAYPRTSCMIPVDYTNNGHAFKDFIMNISPGGAFIETTVAAGSEEKVTLAFSSPSYPHPLKVKGTVVRRMPAGLGIQFMTTSAHLHPFVAAL